MAETERTEQVVGERNYSYLIKLNMLKKEVEKTGFVGKMKGYSSW
jgi:hypothetical protein